MDSWTAGWVVLASSHGEVVFTEVAENPDFRAELQDAFLSGLLALGLLAWELKEGTIQARSMIFPWHKDSKTLCNLFKKLCEEA